jgi:hypothetical protein
VFKKIALKLGNMRSAQNFLVHMDTNNTIYGQSDKSIFRVDSVTGLGFANTKGCYFHHLSMIDELLPVALSDAELVEMHRIFPLRGDKIGDTPITGVVTYEQTVTAGESDVFEARFRVLKMHHLVRMLNVHPAFVQKGDGIWYRGTEPYIVTKVMKTKLIATDSPKTDGTEFQYRFVTLAHRRLLLPTAEILAAREASGAPDGIEIMPDVRLPYYGNAVAAWQQIHTAAIPGIVATAHPTDQRLTIEDTRPRNNEPVHDVFTVVYDADTIDRVLYADSPAWKATSWT